MKKKLFGKNLLLALVAAVALLGNASKIAIVDEPESNVYTDYQATVDDNIEAESVDIVESAEETAPAEQTEPEVTVEQVESAEITEEPVEKLQEETISAEAKLTATSAYTTQSNVYKYCPTCIDGTILYCSNEDSPGKVKDGIYLNGTKVLSTTKNSWDSAQVCDPSVITGDFTYNGANYNYLMAYLGCATLDCTANEIGFAVSNDLRNWTKTGKVVSAKRDGFWGVGQPSLINYNDNVFLFYTSGTAQATTSYVEQLDCADLNNIDRLGTQQISCSYDFISNGDFAYGDGMLYMTCDTHPFPAGSLNFISAVQSVYSAPWDGTLNSIANMNWTRIAQIGSGTTGHERNHNGCFYRDGSGQLTSRVVFVTTADAIGSFTDNLFTYRFADYGF